jgi:hypothetical protein
MENPNTNKKCNYRSHKATPRTSSGARSEEITITAIRYWGSYRRRGENLGKIRQQVRKSRVEKYGYQSHKLY